MSNRKRANMQANRPALPPIINEDDGELPFFKQDFFSDVALIVSSVERGDPDHHGARKPKNVVSGRKLFTARCILAYNSPVFEKSLGNAKKHEMDMSDKNFDDIVELLCYLDPRVQYTLTAQTAKQLLPLSEEYEIHKLRKLCESTLYSTYLKLRKDHKLGSIPSETNEEYLLLADRYGMQELLHLCVEEYVSSADATSAKSAVNNATLSEKVKLMILRKKLEKLNINLERERRYRTEAEMKANMMKPKTNWKKYWHIDEGPEVRYTYGS